jgi:hypothetical protein
VWATVFHELVGDFTDSGTTQLFGEFEVGELDSHNKATATGLTLRLVECESCRHQYGYLLKAVATVRAGGSESRGGQAVDEAAKVAKAKVKKRLKHALELVPCPDCGWVQDNMRALARKAHLRWLMYVSAALCFLAILLSAGATVTLAVTRRASEGILLYLVVAVVAFGLIGLGLLALRLLLATLHEPNRSNPNRQRQLGAQRALTPKKLVRALELFKQQRYILQSDAD